MARQAIIEQTIKVIDRLPKEEVEEISDFAEYILKKIRRSAERHSTTCC